VKTGSTAYGPEQFFRHPHSFSWLSSNRADLFNREFASIADVANQAGYYQPLALFAR
jgi:hypothetical protein